MGHTAAAGREYAGSATVCEFVVHYIYGPFQIALRPTRFTGAFQLQLVMPNRSKGCHITIQVSMTLRDSLDRGIKLASNLKHFATMQWFMRIMLV